MKLEHYSQFRLKKPTIRYIAYAIIAMLLSLAHLVYNSFISVGGITPDLLLIMCVWISLREGQFVGLFAGFGFGLLFDLITYDVVGTNALAKTVVAFVAGMFYKENLADTIIRSYKFLLIVLLCSFIHNIIYFFFYLKSSEASFLSFFVKYGVASSFYTTVFAVIVLLARFPSRRIKTSV